MKTSMAVSDSDGGGTTEPMCTLLTTVEEQVCAPRVRLFKWNESMFRDEYFNCGIIMIRVYNHIKNRSISPDYDDITVELGHEHNQLVGLFDLSYLLPGNSIKSVVKMALTETNAIVNHNIIDDLAEKISVNLCSNFRFSETTLSCPSTRRIVVLVELDTFTTNEYRVIEDDDETETETNMGIMNPGCGNDDDRCGQCVDQFVDESVGEAADDFMESETREEEEGEDDQFVDDSVGAAEDDDQDDVMELEEEEKEAEYDYVAELMDIEGTIWRFLGDMSSEIIRGDREFSRDSKGLTEVESAIEIITDFRDGNVSEEGDLCPCCLDKIVVEGKVVAKTPCSHLFHRDCLYVWLSTNDSCPLCRAKCSTYV